MKNKIEIIDETVAFYGEDTDRRAMTNQLCSYLEPNGNRCAVGRCILDEHIEAAQNVAGQVRDLVDELEVTLDSILKPEYEGHDLFFWDDLQFLHDNEAYWNEGAGLSEEGEKQVRILKTKYKNWG